MDDERVLYILLTLLLGPGPREFLCVDAGYRAENGRGMIYYPLRWTWFRRKLRRPGGCRNSASAPITHKMLGVVLLTSVLSNHQPFSCACERVAVTLTGDALRWQSGWAGLYTLMQNVTSLDRPVYRRAGCDGDDEYLHSVVYGEYGFERWLIGPDYTRNLGGIGSSGSSNFFCPEHAPWWGFVDTNGNWSSSGGVDVACCGAGSACEDSFEDPCTGTSMDFRVIRGGIWAGLIVGILAFCILLSCIDALVKVWENGSLRSDAAVQCEGTLAAAPVECVAHYLEWEFHVPGRILISAVPGLAASIPNDHGARATGRLKVHKELHQAHASGLPKSCTVRYLPVDPRRNQLLKVGDDDRPSRNPLGTCTLGRLVQVFLSMFTISCCIGLGFVLKIRIGSWSDMTPASTAGFIAVVGIFVVLAIAMNVRVYYMLNPWPCGTPRKAYCSLTWLSSPYQRPQPQPHAQPQIQLVPPVTGVLLNSAPAQVTEAPALVTTQPSRADVAPAAAMMNVTCPPGVQPGQTIALTTTSGAPMGNVVVRALSNPTRPPHTAYGIPTHTWPQFALPACSRAQVPPGVAPGVAFEVRL